MGDRGRQWFEQGRSEVKCMTIISCLPSHFLPHFFCLYWCTSPPSPCLASCLIASLCLAFFTSPSLTRLRKQVCLLMLMLIWFHFVRGWSGFPVTIQINPTYYRLPNWITRSIRGILLTYTVGEFVQIPCSRPGERENHVTALLWESRWHATPMKTRSDMDDLTGRLYQAILNGVVALFTCRYCCSSHSNSMFSSHVAQSSSLSSTQ